MSYQVGYRLARPNSQSTPETMLDRLAPIRTLNRIANLACQKFILLMNNTQLIKEKRVQNMDQILVYLRGMHDDVGLSGDRGDFYKRKLAEQVYLCYKIEGVTHVNIETIVHTAMQLEAETRRILRTLDGNVPAVNMDEDILHILSRLAEVF